MREVGIVIWVVFIVIGVIANIASTVRKQQNASKAPLRTPRTVQPSQASAWPPAAPVTKAIVPTPASIASASPAPVRRPQAPRAPVTLAALPLITLREPSVRPSRPFFGDAPSLVRAVIAAEVLGKPRALRDE